MPVETGMADMLIQHKREPGIEVINGGGDTNTSKRTPSTIELSYDGPVTIASLCAPPWHGENSENVLSPQMFEDLCAVLSEMEHVEGSALIITSRGKWFCNGLDMRLMDGGGLRATRYVSSFYRFLGHLLAFPRPIIAAINGHAFAGGLLLALACDYRLMADGVGLLCMPEVDMNGHVQPGLFSSADQQMLSVLQNKLPPLLVRDLMLQGRRLTAGEAQLRGIIEQAIPADDLLHAAVRMAKMMGQKPKGSFGVIKRELSRGVLAILDPECECAKLAAARPCAKL
jgi:enoyl-CoA hydratase/carnithine racemase